MVAEWIYEQLLIQVAKSYRPQDKYRSGEDYFYKKVQFDLKFRQMLCIIWKKYNGVCQLQV